MKLADLTKNVTTMSDEELREHVRKLRHNKNVIRPAAAKRVEEVQKVEKRRQTVKVSKVLSMLSDADKRQLMLLLEGGK